ncbi:MAG: glycosyltransferase [Chitinivibrionales bacterium]|nr:glycosyltransferase [Chitinivibrionales bacterium]
MKILMVNYEFPPVGGGAGRATRHLCEKIAAQGVDVDVVTSRGATREKFLCGKARVFSLPVHRKSIHQTGLRGMIAFVWHAVYCIRKLMKTESYSLIHYFFSVPTGMISLATNRSTPYIVSLRGGDVPGYNPGEFQILHLLLKPVNINIWKRAARVVALSEHLGRAAQRSWNRLHFSTIPNGVDTRLFHPKRKSRDSEKCLNLLCVGRLVPWKGIDYLLDAVALIDEFEWKLTLIGTGPFKNHLLKKAEQQGVNKKIRFIEAQPHEELPNWYSNADIFVLPSFGDSFGQVFLEAMACGLPVIAAQSGEIQNILCHEKGGRLVKPRDSISLKKALLFLGKNSGLQKKMGNFNREMVVEKYSWDAAATGYVHEYTRVTSAS